MAREIDRLKGTVKWFDCKKGFGFITPDDGGDDLFVHHSSIKAAGFRSLAEDETVEFIVVVDVDGRTSAFNVTGPDGAYVHGQRYGGGGGRRGGVGPCYSCGGMGHFARECPRILYRAEPPSFSPVLSTMTMDFNSLEDDQWFSSEYTDPIDEEDEEEPPTVVEERNWADLPQDVLLLIFKKIAAIGIIRSAQFVCRPWRQLSHEPELWRCIDMTGYSACFNMINMHSMAMEVVDRSEGRLEEFYAEYFGSDELMRYIAERTTRLRCLRLISTYQISEEGLVKAVRTYPQLEELEISLCSFSSEVVELVGLACPQLKSFRLNKQPYMLEGYLGIDVEAFAIAKHMRQLCRLQLFGNELTNAGLLAILDNCPYLECLDIRRCLHVCLNENLKKKCARIKDTRLPNDTTADYEFDAAIAGLEICYTDDDPFLSDSEYDFLYGGDGYADYDYGYGNFYYG